MGEGGGERGEGGETGEGEGRGRGNERERELEVDREKVGVGGRAFEEGKRKRGYSKPNQHTNIPSS